MRSWVVVVGLVSACSSHTSTSTSSGAGSATPVIAELAPNGWGSAIADLDPKLTSLGCSSALVLSPPSGSGTRVALPGIERFTQLQELCIANAGLTAWPDAIAKLPLKRLELKQNAPHLDLSHASLPPTLESLSLDDAVTALPPLGGLPHLARLFVHGNGLAVIPAELWTAPALADVTFFEDHVRQLPGVEQAKALASLVVPIHLEVGEVTRLTALAADRKIRLSNAGVAESLSAALADPSAAYRVVIDAKDPALGKPKPTLPRELFALTGLRELTIIDVPIASLPSDLGKLVNLTSLTIHRTRIKALPPELGRLVELRELDLDNNELVALPDELGKLVQLESLSVARNRIAALPASISSLAKLATVDADGNRIASLPDLSGLTALTTLLLWDNALVAMPDKLAPSIKTLDLRRNLFDPRTYVRPAAHGFELEPDTAGDTQADDAFASNRSSVSSETRVVTVWPPDEVSASSTWKVRTLALQPHPIANQPYKPMTSLPDLRSYSELGELVVAGTALKQLPSWLPQLTKLHWLDVSNCADLEESPALDRMVGLTIIDGDCESRMPVLVAKSISIVVLASCTDTKLVERTASGDTTLATLDAHGVLAIPNQPSVTLAASRIVDWLALVSWKQPGKSIAITANGSALELTLE